MAEDRVEKGCMWFAGTLGSFIIGAAIGGAVGMFLGQPMIALGIAVFTGPISSAIWRGWYRNMANTQAKHPIRAVFKFLFMFILLAIGLIFLIFMFGR